MGTFSDEEHQLYSKTGSAGTDADYKRVTLKKLAVNPAEKYTYTTAGLGRLAQIGSNYFAYTEVQKNKVDEDGNPVKGPDGKPVKETDYFHYVAQAKVPDGDTITLDLGRYGAVGETFYTFSDPTPTDTPGTWNVVRDGVVVEETSVRDDLVKGVHKLGDYMEAEANQLYVAVHSDAYGDVYLPVEIIRVKEEEAPKAPDAYDKWEYSRNETVTDIRTATTRNVIFHIPLKDPGIPYKTNENGQWLLREKGTDVLTSDIAVDVNYNADGTPNLGAYDEGDNAGTYEIIPYTFENYRVDGRTLAWVATGENDPYFHHNEIKYDPKFLESFGMDNNWIEHDTLFLPSGENDAWQYNETPWFAATILNSADNLEPSEYTDIVEAQGNLKHAKLVYALHLPSQVTFYDDRMLTDDKKLAGWSDEKQTSTSPNYKWIGDYTDDDYAFYVERTYRDRHAEVADPAAGDYVVDAAAHKIERWVTVAENNDKDNAI